MASQTTSCYKPGSVSAPSAGWSSPSAGWGSSQAAGTTQNWSSNQGSQNRSSNHSEGSSSPSLTQKAKEYLPGQDTSQSGSTVNHSAKAGANEGLLDKAKEYLPGTDSSRSAGSAWQSNAGQQQESDNRSDLLLVSKLLRYHACFATRQLVHCTAHLAAMSAAVMMMCFVLDFVIYVHGSKHHL